MPFPNDRFNKVYWTTICWRHRFQFFPVHFHRQLWMNVCMCMRRLHFVTNGKNVTEGKIISMKTEAIDRRTNFHSFTCYSPVCVSLNVFFYFISFQFTICSVLQSTAKDISVKIANNRRRKKSRKKKIKVSFTCVMVEHLISYPLNTNVGPIYDWYVTNIRPT